jgi:heme exporter protein A
MYSLIAENLGKRFGSLKVFSGISFKLETGRSLAIVGPNGSGKSTLLLMLLGQYHPTAGKVTFERDSSALDEDAVRDSTALIAPYLHFYDHLTAEENLTFFANVAGKSLTGKQINSTLSRVGLEGRGDDPVGTYSSGMKQRLKYAAAVLKDSAYLFLDEPTSNLDQPGKEMVREIITEIRQKTIVLIATNEEEEYALADGVCRVNQ